MSWLGSHHPMRHLEKIPLLLEGVMVCFLTSSGFRLHLVADILAFGLAGWLGISQGGWIALVIVTVLKASFELVNSAIEDLVDEHWPREEGFNGDAKRIKDFAGSAVLLTIIGSFAIWGILFIPELSRLVS